MSHIVCLIINTKLRLDPDSNSEDELEDFREIDSDSNGYLDINEGRIIQIE